MEGIQDTCKAFKITVKQCLQKKLELLTFYFAKDIFLKDDLMDTDILKRLIN